MEGASGGHLWVVPKLVERELADDLWILSCAGKDIKEREKHQRGLLDGAISLLCETSVSIRT